MDHLRLEPAGFSSLFDTGNMPTMLLGFASRLISLEALGSGRIGPLKNPTTIRGESSLRRIFRLQSTSRASILP